MMMVRPWRLQMSSISSMPIFSSLGIEAGQPFVEQQHARIGRERARQFDALLVDIGHRGDRHMLAATQADQRQQFVRERRAPARPTAADGRTPRPRSRYAPHPSPAACARAGRCVPRPPRDLVRRQSGNPRAGQHDLARIRLQRAGNQIEHRGLAGPVRADQPEQFAVLDLETDIVRPRPGRRRPCAHR